MRRYALPVGAGLLLAVAAFLAGRELRGGSDAPAAIDIEGPAFEAAGSIAGVSPGGFSGFGELPGLEGHTVLAGRVVSASASQLVIESPGGERSTIRLAGEGSLSRIDSAGLGELRPGVTVVVRRDESGAAAAVLLVTGP